MYGEDPQHKSKMTILLEGFQLFNNQSPLSLSVPSRTGVLQAEHTAGHVEDTWSGPSPCLQEEAIPLSEADPSIKKTAGR